MEREKKQFRLFDIYRQFAIQTSSKIKGIRSYKVGRYFYEYEISVVYDNGSETSFTAKNEDELKQIVWKVNKQLKNCSKPGRKQKVNY